MTDLTVDAVAEAAARRAPAGQNRALI